MSTYAIGDLQGCHASLLRLLDTLRFDPAADRLWFVGDLVNRGPDSLAVLRTLKALGGTATVVLGNHDLHLLALDAGYGKPYKGDTLEAVLAAPDRVELMTWLRTRKLAHCEDGCLMIHAGVLPGWSAVDALRLAAEAEAVIGGPDYRQFFERMYGNTPTAWDEDLHGIERLRGIVNTFTRLRYCTPDGSFDFHHKGKPGSQPSGLLPWFDVPGRASRDVSCVFGHWSTLGFVNRPDLIALDTGCLWGGTLTAVRLEDRAVFAVSCPPTCQPKTP